MELRHLRYFVAVAEEQNVTRAAARLHVSQPPLSRQIRDLEEELGVELFRRTAKSLALTEPGRLFLGEAQEVLLRAEQAVQAVRAVASGVRGKLKLGYAPSLSVRLLPKALGLFEQECPGARVSLHDLSSEECTDQILSRKLDLALTVPPVSRNRKGLVFEKLGTHAIRCAVASTHPLARRRVLTIPQLKVERLIAYSEKEYPEYHVWLKKLLSLGAGEKAPVMEEYDSVTALIAAVEAGRGVAVVSSSIAHLSGPRLKLLPLSPEEAPFVIGVLYLPGPSPLVLKFLESLKRASVGEKNGQE